MAYADFTLSGLVRQFALRIVEDEPLFPASTPIELDPAFLARLRDDAAMALSISTEKARSEFIIAPILAELRRLCQRRIGLFSGVEFAVDAASGLAGICDYIITRSPEQLFVTAPVLMLVEAKNEDMKRGYAQCIAEMLAAQAFNAREDDQPAPVYGVVTIGNIWRFLRLDGLTARIDSREYHLDSVERIMGILVSLASSASIEAANNIA